MFICSVYLGDDERASDKMRTADLQNVRKVNRVRVRVMVKFTVRVRVRVVVRIRVLSASTSAFQPIVPHN